MFQVLTVVGSRGLDGVSLGPTAGRGSDIWSGTELFAESRWCTQVFCPHRIMRRRGGSFLYMENGSVHSLASMLFNSYEQGVGQSTGDPEQSLPDLNLQPCAHSSSPMGDRRVNVCLCCVGLAQCEWSGRASRRWLLRTRSPHWCRSMCS